MSVETPQAQDVVRNVTVRLVNEFSTKLSSVAVGVIVRAAYRDLQEQVVPEALGDMLHRLAHHRIARLVRVL
ncbi:hypothetical protein AB0N89_19810 [Amycolatopsis sp. NPDC089917]|uniref:hypothetical protein n=1 Tax=Amycolatopsis sp. NPDC089917 TaxID=3155187 RepID=UPI00341407B9